MNNKAIKQFVEAIQKVEYLSQNSSLKLMVKYRADEKFYDPRFPLPKGNYITDIGIKDPGFGIGPTNFSDIEVIRVRTKQVHHRMSEIDYVKKIERLKKLVSDLKGLKISPEYIEFTNIGT